VQSAEGLFHLSGPPDLRSIPFCGAIMNSKKRLDTAIRHFRGNFNCAQSVFSAYARDFEIEETDARRIASGFGGGMGALQKTCGAVTGGIMAIGAKYFDESDIAGSRTLVYKQVRRLVVRFEAKHGTVECFSLLGMDITTEEGLQRARAQQLFQLKCERYVLDVCGILEELMYETGGTAP
jgi:C_GCAxxG_C_C family probable redox protein